MAFTPTHRYRATHGDPVIDVRVVLWDPAYAHGRQVCVEMEDRPGEWRISADALIPLDACCCEYEDDGDGESGPHVVHHVSPKCPVHNPSYNGEPQVLTDAAQDGPKLAIFRNRGLLDLVVAPDGNFEDELDNRGVTIEIDDLLDALRKLQVLTGTEA